jgi:uncharacterized protein YfkK (UPF0435 family)
MARKSKVVKNNTTNELGLSDLRLRLNFLEKENTKLIKQIETNRTKVTNLHDSIDQVRIQFAERVAPMRQKMSELDEKLHAVFQDIFAGRKLGKKSRQDIETIYHRLQMQGIISPQHLPIESEESSIFEDEPDRENYAGRFPQEFAEDIAKPDREELKKIRQLFLRLADSFHPDKVTDIAEKEYRTEIMKEINLAYQDGDLARLLAIEKQQELGLIIDRDSSDDMTRHCAKVEAENNYLKEQLETIKQQLKATKRTELGEMTAIFKRITKYGGDPIKEALNDFEIHISQVEKTYEFVLAFRDRRITIKEFLQGPEEMIEQEMIEEEFFF